MEKIAVSVPEAAKMLGLASKTVYTLTHRADFPAVKVGSRTLIPVESLVEWMKAQAGKEVEL